MAYIDGVFKTIDSVLFNINELFGQSASSYVKLETSHDDHTICASDGSLVSILELLGTCEVAGVDEIEDAIQSLTTALHANFDSVGHLLQVVYSYNPERVSDDIDPIVDNIVVTAKNIGMNLDSLIKDWGDNVKKWCSSERVFLVCWTLPGYLPPADKKNETKKMGKNIINSPKGEKAQLIAKVLHGIEDAHQNFVNSVFGGLESGRLLCRALDAHEALWWARHEIDPSFTSKSWSPLLPGDPIPQRTPDIGTSKYDKSCCLYPKIHDQLFVREPEIIDRQVVKIGDYLHAPLVMSLPPQQVRYFNALFKQLLSKRMPWRISILIDGSGTQTLWWKKIFTSILHFTSTANKKFNNAIEELSQMELDNECIVKMQVTFDTWANANKDGAYALLKRRMSELASAVQAWGTADVQEVIGDPMLGMCATVPAVMPSSPAPGAAAPLPDVIKMLPLSRPASIWKQGSFMLRSHDGKIMPYQPGSSLQAAWIDIGVAPMGGGKSVFLNSYNLAYCLQSGLMRLPFLSIIDIGPSSKGLIQLIKYALPPDKRYLATYQRLKMHQDHSINPFDLPLGCRYPLPSHKSFLVNLLSILCTPLDKDAPQSGVDGIARMAIDMAYDNMSDEKSPKIYNSLVNPQIHDLVTNLEIKIDDKTSWWEIVDALYDHGYIHEASVAQRYAVPLLADVAAFAKRNAITQMYDYTCDSGEPITQYFWRCCTEALTAYPILKNPTKFDVGDARVVSLDLMEVAPKGGVEATRQSGIMFMLARQVIGAKFFLMPDDVQFIPPKYKGHHQKNIEEVRKDPKRLCYDEMHRAISKDQSSNLMNQISKDLETAARESRKWNLSIGLYTQSIKDFPDILLNLATSIFILGSGGQKDRQELASILGINSSVQTAIKNLGKPSAKGANMIAIMRTDKGELTQLLTNSVSMQALWALSSTTEDTTVRDALYERIGFNKTLEVLTKFYPGGIKPEVEKRKSLAMEKDLREEKKDIEQELIEEIEDQAKQF